MAGEKGTVNGNFEFRIRNSNLCIAPGWAARAALRHLIIRYLNSQLAIRIAGCGSITDLIGLPDLKLKLKLKSKLILCPSSERQVDDGSALHSATNPRVLPACYLLAHSFVHPISTTAWRPSYPPAGPG
jgi:hypothetical protein